MNYNNVVFEKSLGTIKDLEASDRAEICFSGRSNVGKSSLINKIFTRKALARVSARPGKTVTINFFKCDNLRMADLPGYGFAKVAHSEKVRWGKMMEGYFTSGRDIALVFQLVDMRHPPSSDDLDMLNYLIGTGNDFAIILTKSDKLKPTERKKREEEIEKELNFVPPDIPIIPFSAVNGEGVDKIRNLIDEISDEEMKDGE